MKKISSYLLISSLLLPNIVFAESGVNLASDISNESVISRSLEEQQSIVDESFEELKIEQDVESKEAQVVIENKGSESTSVTNNYIDNVEERTLTLNNNQNFEKPNFSAWTYVTFMVYSPELNAYFPQGDTLMIRGQVGETQDLPTPEDPNLIYEKGPTTVTHGKTEQNIQVFYKYKDVKPMGGQISIKYLTIDGKILENETFINGRVDSEYYVDVYDFTSRGYEFSHSTGAPLQGVFDANKKSIVVYYKPIKDAPIESAPITVQYKDESGLIIGDTKTMKGNIGENYNLDIPIFEGYTYKSSSHSLSGTYTDKSATIVLTYSKNKLVEESKAVTVSYVDENGETIRANEELTGKLGESYSVKTPKITGYTYKSASAPLTGKFTTSAQSVVLTYVKDTKLIEESKGKNDTNLEKKKNTEKEEIKKTTNDKAINNKNELPKTNELNTHYGLLGILFLGLYVLIKRKTI